MAVACRTTWLRSKSQMRTLIPVLGDQLSIDIAALAGADPATTIVLMMEVADETTYVRHHKKKIAYLFSAMRHHADAVARGRLDSGLRHAGRPGQHRQFHRRGRARRHPSRARPDRRDRSGRMARRRDARQLGDAVRPARRHPHRHPLHRQPCRFRGMGGGSQIAADGVFLPSHAPPYRVADGRRKSGWRRMEFRRAEPQARERGPADAAAFELPAGCDHDRRAGAGRRPVRGSSRYAGRLRLRGDARATPRGNRRISWSMPCRGSGITRTRC